MNWKKKLISFLLAGVMLFTVAPAFAAGADTVQTVQLDVTFGQTEARSMLDMVNNFRTGDDAWAYDQSGAKVSYSGLSELAYDYDLEQVAMQRAAEIALSFAHTRPNGSSCFTASYHGQSSSGENIAAGYTTASGAFEGWQETNQNYSGQGHRRNMLGHSFTSIGIGHAVYNGVHYWVQEFGISVSSAAATPANNAKQTVDIDVMQSNVEAIVNAKPNSLIVGANDTVDLPVLNIQLRMPDTWGGARTVSAACTWTVTDGAKAQIVGTQLKGLEAGSTTITTTVFGKSVAVPVTVRPPCDHLYENGICTKCGAGEPNCPIDDFIDIEKGYWYHDGVHYVLQHNLMSGTSIKIFSPTASVTRGTVAQILYSRAGSPKVSGTIPFTDVPAGKWYADAITWAANNGIVSGIGNGLFGPENKVTREQVAVMLHSAAHAPTVSGSLNYSDASSVSIWAKNSVIWAVGNGIISGSVDHGKTVLNPQGSATRVQIAAMMMQFDQKIPK